MVLPDCTDFAGALPLALTCRVVLPLVVDLPSERPVVDVWRVVLPLVVDFDTCLPELLWLRLELLTSCWRSCGMTSSCWQPVRHPQWRMRELDDNGSEAHAVRPTMKRHD